MNIQHNLDELIVMHIGDGILQAANSKDDRNIIRKVFQRNLPPDAQLLLDNIKNLRNKLFQNGIDLPTCRVISNSDLKYNEIVIQYGIELFQGTIQTLNEITDFLKDKSIEYQNESLNFDFKELSDRAIREVREDNYQEAFNIYKIIYFYTHLSNPIRVKDKERLHINAINDIAGINLKNNNIPVTEILFKKATYLCQAQNILDVALKIQIFINHAEFLKDNNNYEWASQYYSQAANLSKSSNNYFFLLISCLGAGQSYCLLNNQDMALNYFYYALDIIPNTLQNAPLKLELSTSINNLQSLIIRNNRVQINQLQKIVYNLQSQHNSIIKGIATNILQSVIESLVIKILGIPATGALMLFGKVTNTEIKTIENSGVLQIGEKNVLIQ